MTMTVPRITSKGESPIGMPEPLLSRLIQSGIRSVRESSKLRSPVCTSAQQAAIK